MFFAVFTSPHSYLFRHRWQHLFSAESCISSTFFSLEEIRPLLSNSISIFFESMGMGLIFLKKRLRYGCSQECYHQRAVYAKSKIRPDVAVSITQLQSLMNDPVRIDVAIQGSRLQHIPKPPHLSYSTHPFFIHWSVTKWQCSNLRDTAGSFGATTGGICAGTEVWGSLHARCTEMHPAMRCNVKDASFEPTLLNYRGSSGRIC